MSHPCGSSQMLGKGAVTQARYRIAWTVRRYTHVVSGVLAIQVAGHGITGEGAQEELTVGAVELCGSASDLALALQIGALLRLRAAGAAISLNEQQASNTSGPGSNTVASTDCKVLGAPGIRLTLAGRSRAALERRSWAMISACFDPGWDS